jgi:hypothetical protein
MKYEYKKVTGYEQKKFIENGHTMFEEDVLRRLKRLAYLEEQTKQANGVEKSDSNCNIPLVSGRFSELDMRESFKAGAIYERSCEHYSKQSKITMAGHLVSNPTPDFSEFIHDYNDR